MVAVLDIKFVKIQHSINTTKVRTYGEGFSPKTPITFLAISSPAPVVCNADASESVPPKRKIVFKSMDFNAFFSLMTPVKISANAPIHPVIQSLIPICSSNIMPRSVNTKIIKDNACFHFGTLEKSFCSS